MSIYTHNAVLANSDTDNAVFEQKDSIGANCYFWLPCDEGTGTTVTDESRTGVGLDNADAQETVNYSAANRMNLCITSSGSPVAPSTGDVSTIAIGTNSFVMLYSGTANAIIAPSLDFQLGADAGPCVGFEWTSSTFFINDSSTSESVSLTGIGVAGGSDLKAAAVVDRDAGTITVYAALGSNAMTTYTGSIGSVGSLTPVNALLIGGNASFLANFYGLGLHIFSDGVPSTIADDIDEWMTNMRGSNKTLPVNWISED